MVCMGQLAGVVAMANIGSCCPPPVPPPIIYVGTLLVVLGLGAAVSFHILVVPLRRQERARIFLDIVETCLDQGESIEFGLVTLADDLRRSPRVLPRLMDVWLLERLRFYPWLFLRDKTLGLEFQLLARRLQRGEPLGEALRGLHTLLPAHPAAMFAVGCETGDVRGVLPACREALDGAASRMKGALNYLSVAASSLFFFGLVVLLFIVTMVLPRYRTLAEDLRLATARWALPREGVAGMMLSESPPLALFIGAVALAGVLLVCAVLYATGPRSPRWLGFGALSDRLVLLLSWRRKRLERDFSAVLARLLDGGTPEAEAVRLASESTANRVLVRRGREVVAALASGEPLAEAIGRIDGRGELRWRLANAHHRGTGFLEALDGWHAALAAQAFRQEQTAAQALSTALVLANGAVVGLFAVGMVKLILAFTRALGT